MARLVLRRLCTKPRTMKVCAAALLIAALAISRFFGTPTYEPPLQSAGEYRVVRVVDGDTLLIETGHRVRLLGVDTPETKHPHRPREPFGEDAAEFTRRAVEGRVVRLELDRHRVDHYGRTLAFVWVEDDLLNEELIRQGYSRAETRFPLRSDYQKRLVDAETLARKERLGIWTLSGGDERRRQSFRTRSRIRPLQWLIADERSSADNIDWDFHQRPLYE